MLGVRSSGAARQNVTSKTESKDVLERTCWAGRAAPLLSNSVLPYI